MKHFCMSQVKSIKMSPGQYFVCDTGTCLCNWLWTVTKIQPFLYLSILRRSKVTIVTKLPGYTWEGKFFLLVSQAQEKYSRGFVS